MKFSRTDWPLIKVGVLIFLITLGGGGAVIWLSENYLQNAHANQQSSQRQLNEARMQLANAQEDRENMQSYTAEYNTLLNRNILNANQRLDWIEGLEKIRRQNYVLDFKYTISPQQNFAPNPPLDNGNFDLKQSGMALQFDLLHEGQLINFFNALHTQVKGRFILEQCTLERQSTSLDNSLNATTQLKASCAGGWLALKDRNIP